MHPVKIESMIDINKIRTIPDFPTPGILFYDITTILNDADAYQDVFQTLLTEATKINPTVIVALEARGFFFGPALALALKVPFVPIRKKGKLPHTTFQETYGLEYGEAVIEIHTDAIKPQQTVLLFDDVLATGGTAEAAVKLIERFDPQKITALFFLELPDLHGRDRLKGYDVTTLLTV